MNTISQTKSLDDILLPDNETLSVLTGIKVSSEYEVDTLKEDIDIFVDPTSLIYE